MDLQSESILQKNYNKLQQERIEIERIIKENETLDSAYIDGNLYVSSNYYNYIVYLFVALFLLFLLIRLGVSNEQNGGSITLERNKSTFGILGLCVIIILNTIVKN